MGNDQFFDKARSKHTARKYEEAIKLYQMVLMKNPKHLDATYLLGTAYAEIGKLDAAKKYLLKAENLMPYSPYIKVNLGTIYKEQGEYETAFISFVDALELQHDLPEARQNLVTVIEMMMDQKSEKAASRCLEYGLSCVRAERKDEALAILVVGNSLDPENTRIRTQIDVLEGKLGS